MPSIKQGAANAVFPKVSFGTIAKKKEKAKSTHPIVPDPTGELGTIASRILSRHVEVEALSGALELDKAELKVLTTPFYFQNASGKREVPTGVVVPCANGEVLIGFPNRYAKLESEECLYPVLGENTGSYFRQAFALEIDGDKLPAEYAETLLEELQILFAKFNATEALNVKECVKPVPEFHTLRHTALTCSQNLALHQICPIICMIRPKPGA